MAFTPSSSDTPFERLGGEPAIRSIVEHFYDAMGELERALARLHPCDSDGRVCRASRDRFALFFIGWLGGPQDYVVQYGHPRLRMRHARVPIDSVMANAWLRCMRAAFDRAEVGDEVRAFLERKLVDLAAFLRNLPG